MSSGFAPSTVVTEVSKAPHGAEELLLDCWGFTELLLEDAKDELLEDAKDELLEDAKDELLEDAKDELLEDAKDELLEDAKDELLEDELLLDASKSRVPSTKFPQ